VNRFTLCDPGLARPACGRVMVGFPSTSKVVLSVFDIIRLEPAAGFGSKR
jgi:hypothetical protein